MTCGNLVGVSYIVGTKGLFIDSTVQEQDIYHAKY